MYKLKLLSMASAHTSANTASEATLLLVVNTDQSNSYDVTLTDASNNNVGQFFIPSNGSMLLEKEKTEKVASNAAVRFTKVAHR